MYSITMDTSGLFLIIALMDDQKVIDSIQMECLKKQSEYIIVKIDELLSRNQLDIDEVSNIVITVGPGSYTGVRIAMTVAKVLGSIAAKNIYTLSTLQLYAGKRDCYVLMDAKAKRCYVGNYCNGMALSEDTVMPNEEIEALMARSDRPFIGDLHVFKQEDVYYDLAQNFFDLKDQWVKVEDVDTLAPTYLKNKEDYLK